MYCNRLAGLVLGLAAAVVVAAPAQAQRGRGGFGQGRSQSLIGLAGNEMVQKEIGLTDASQVESLGEDYQAAVRKELMESGLDFAGLRDLPEAERNAKMREFRTKSEAAMKKVNEEFEPKLKEALTPEQLKRLHEIKIQATGVAALADAHVAKELDLQEEQQKKIADIQAESEKARQELMTSARGDGGGGEALAKLRELNQKSMTQASEVLTPEQREKFTALKGKPFDMAQLTGRGGRRNDKKE